MKKRHYIAISVLLLLCLGCFVKGNTISATGKEKKREVVTVENPMDFAKIQITTEGNRTTEGEETTESVTEEATTVEETTAETEKQPDSEEYLFAAAIAADGANDIAKEAVESQENDTTEAPTEVYAMERYTEKEYTEWVKDRNGIKTRTCRYITYVKYSDGSIAVECDNTQIEKDFDEYASDSTAMMAGKAMYDKNTEYINKVVEYTNKLRAEAGVPPVVLDESLSVAACARVYENMNYEFGHSRPDGSKWYTILDQMGYGYNHACENIAAGQTSPEEVVESWKSSESHYANMIDPACTKIGVGYSADDNYTYGTCWVQLFSD